VNLWLQLNFSTALCLQAFEIASFLSMVKIALDSAFTSPLSTTIPVLLSTASGLPPVL